MDKQHANRLLAGMLLKQAHLLRDDGHLEEAKDLVIKALALVFFAGAFPRTSPLSIGDSRRQARM